jgi:hypothetical protein
MKKLALYKYKDFFIVVVYLELQVQLLELVFWYMRC